MGRHSAPDDDESDDVVDASSSVAVLPEESRPSGRHANDGEPSDAAVDGDDVAVDGDDDAVPAPAESEDRPDSIRGRRRSWGGLRRTERRAERRQAADEDDGDDDEPPSDDDTAPQGLSLIESAFTGGTQERSQEGSPDDEPAAGPQVGALPPAASSWASRAQASPRDDALPGRGVEDPDRTDPGLTLDAQHDTDEFRAVGAEPGRDPASAETTVIPAIPAAGPATPAAEEFPPIDLDRVPADLRPLLAAETAEIPVVEPVAEAPAPSPSAAVAETTELPVVRDPDPEPALAEPAPVEPAPVEPAPVEPVVDDATTETAEPTVDPLVVEPSSVATPVPAAVATPAPAPQPAAARSTAQNRHRNPTSSDLNLLRRHSDVRARCIAAVLVPFVVYIAVMVAVKAELATGLIWIWIPLITAGVLFGAFLDIGHRRYDDSGVTFTGS